MASDGVIEPLDVIEHICPGLVSGAIDFTRGPLGLQRREEALHRRVVPNIAGSAHAADEIAAFRKRWPLGTKQRLAFEMFPNSGQRRSDVVRMAWSHLTADNQKIAVIQQKTGRRLLIAIHRDLLTALAAARRDHVSIIATAYNRPFTVDGFSPWSRNAVAEAGLPLDCQPHGLRKATGRRLAEVGATTKDVMSILGHTTLAEAERYTEEADQIALAEGAVIKLEARTTNKSPQTASDLLGKTQKAERNQGEKVWVGAP